MTTEIRPVKDKQTVTPEGKSIAPRIDGLKIRHLPPIEDVRGELVEVYRSEWDMHPDPLVYVYQVFVRPGSIRGWVVHEKQEDRICVSCGILRWVFFDNRPNSKTYKMLNDFTFSERNRVLFVIPRGVYHAVKNIGETEAVFLNMPTRPYDHADPDKFRLPLKNDLIPFSFDQVSGW